MKRAFTFLLLTTPCLTPAFAAEQKPALADEIVVTTKAVKAADTEWVKPGTVLSGEQLRTQIGQTIGDTLQNQLGITSQSFGAGVGSPVIRGQAGSRVRVMQNSLGNNDVSALSPDHANGVDPIIAERVEVLRGPAALLYGSGAIGGIVNVIDNRIPEQAPEKIIGGAAEQRYDSVTNESSSALKLEGGKSGFAYHVDGFYRDQNNTHISGRAIDEPAVRQVDPSFTHTPIINNPDGLINNSQARSRGGSIGLSRIGDKGLVGVAINSLEKVYGIPADGKTTDNVNIDLRQTKYDFKGQLNRPFAGAEQLRMKFGYTDYQHIELDNGQPATTYTNQAYESRLELAHNPFGIFKGMFGFQSVNSQFAALGDEALVPKSNGDTYSLFAVESFDIGRLNYKFGARGEWQTIQTEQNRHFEYFPVSGSAAASWKINNQQQLELAFTHSQRAPQIPELLSKGVHQATHSYELGNPDLGKEYSNNLDLNYHFTSKSLTVDLGLFHNWVSNYIYHQRSTDVFDLNNELRVPGCPVGAACMPVEETRQTGAVFKGFEVQAKVPLMENRYGSIDLSVFSDYTRGTFDNGNDVPRMPPLRYGAQLSYEADDWTANIRLTRAEAQNYPGLHESKTAGYLLLNLGAQYRLGAWKGSEVLLFARGKNLLNEQIRNSTSYLRNFAPEPGRSAELGVRISY